MKLKDTSLGASYNSLVAVMPGCVGTSVVNCNLPGPVFLASGVAHITPFFTKYAAGPAICSVSNNIAIVAPNPGSVQNPSGNDSATAAQPVPNPACGGAGPKLNITKTAKGCASDPSSTDWLCKFEIRVLNFGASAQPLPLKVMDYNTKPTTFSGAACPLFSPNHWLCSKPAPLASGASWIFTATTRVDPNGVTLADCNVTNTVYIDTPFSWDPGHFAQASQKVPQLFINPGPGPVYVYCDPPSLKLTKVAGKTVKAGDGYDSTFTIKATSTGPDPYRGTVEVDEDLPAGTSYVSSSWACVPATGEDVHCSSPYVDLAVGASTSMTITIHIPKDAAVRNKCSVVNTANVAISAEVLHSDKGAQYTASAKATLPADACAKPPACPTNQVKPGGGCCDTGLIWNGKQCTPPKPIPPKCPRDSHATDSGACQCDTGTHGKPGKCVPDIVVPICKRDSVLVDGACECKPGTHGKPGQCVPDQVIPQCPRDSVTIDGECVCKPDTHGKPGRCQPDLQLPICAQDSTEIDGRCVCLPGTHGKPGRCQPDEVTPPPPVCRQDSQLIDGACVCLPGTHGLPGRCLPDVVIEQPLPIKPLPIRPVATCPEDSHFDKRAQACVCNAPLKGEPGNCQAQIILRLPLNQLPVIK